LIEFKCIVIFVEKLNCGAEEIKNYRKRILPGQLSGRDDDCKRQETVECEGQSWNSKSFLEE
jgi:hypothetical protein